MALTVLPPREAASAEEQALFREARPRRRRRRLFVTTGVVVIAAVTVGAIVDFSSGSNNPPPARLPTPAHRTTPTLASLPSQCTAPQLDVQYRGSQGAAGNWASSFWIADTSTSPCTLESSLTVTLFNSEEDSLKATSTIPSPIRLTPKAAIPPLGQDPSIGQGLADVIIAWLTEANAIMQQGATGSRCPETPFHPQTASMTFSNAQTVVVSQLRVNGLTAVDGMGSVCGSAFLVWNAATLTAPESP